VSTVQRHRWDTLSEGLLALHRLRGRDLRESVWAERVLAIAASLEGLSADRLWVSVRHERAWTVYAAQPHGGPGIREIGRSAVPALESWRTTATPVGDAVVASSAWAADCRRLGLLAPLWIWPLIGQTDCHGFLAAAPAEADEELRAQLSHLGRHAGNALENVRLVQELERDAQTDGLTNAYNYRYFMSCLRREMQRVSRSEGSLAVLMVDVDNLKEYNDRFGHLGGSAALKELALLLRRNTRAIDIVAKYGGDEFCVLLPGCNADGARRCATRVLGRVEEHRFENDPQRRLTISTGIAVHPRDGAQDARELLRRADEQLFEAKGAGRNCVRGPAS